MKTAEALAENPPPPKKNVLLKEMAAHSMLLCNAVIYHSMWTISVNHLLSLACVRSLNSGKKKVYME